MGNVHLHKDVTSSLENVDLKALSRFVAKLQLRRRHHALPHTFLTSMANRPECGLAMAKLSLFVDGTARNGIEDCSRLLCLVYAGPASRSLTYYARRVNQNHGYCTATQTDSFGSHIEITPEHHGNLFFWHFQNKHIANRQRTVIWINGGPGCSSMDGALMEIGPYRLKDDAHLVYNEGSWDEFANVLFVDNPVGTGFSYVDTDSYVQELSDMADQMVVFLEKFFSLFPEYAQNDVSQTIEAIFRSRLMEMAALH